MKETDGRLTFDPLDLLHAIVSRVVCGNFSNKFKVTGVRTGGVTRSDPGLDKCKRHAQALTVARESTVYFRKSKSKFQVREAFKFINLMLCSLGS